MKALVDIFSLRILQTETPRTERWIKQAHTRNLQPLGPTATTIKQSLTASQISITTHTKVLYLLPYKKIHCNEIRFVPGR